MNLCARFAIKPPPIEITYESVRYELDQHSYPKKDYVVHIASRAPHKKTEWLIKLWTQAIKEGRDLPLLKVIGSLPESVAPLVQVERGIEKLPFLDDEEYKQTIATARALIIPSEIEGFGLAAVEAYCLGTPACYVRGTAVDEVVGIREGIGAFELSDSTSIFNALDEVLKLSSAVVQYTRLRLQKTYSSKLF